MVTRSSRRPVSIPITPFLPRHVITDPATAKATKSTPKKRTKKDAEADAGNEDDNGEIPRKRRKTPTKKALQADIANGDEGEEVDMPKKKKKSPVKKPKIVKAEADEDAVADVEEGEVVKTEADSED